MRLKVKQSTLNRLFALSGNECAYPSCKQILVDNSGNFTANVCHIEAANIKGERYNLKQSDEERRAFENLILLCPTHHSVTNNTVEYTVSKLKKMKESHEKLYANNPYAAPKTAVVQAQQQTITNNQSNTAVQGPQYNVSNGNLLVGMDAPQVYSLVMQILSTQFPDLVKQASDTATQRVMDFIGRLDGTDNGLSEHLAEPEFYRTFESAVKNAAVSSSEEYRQYLANLLKAKISTPTTNHNMQVSYNDAIEILPKISPNQLKIVALKFVLSRVKFTGQISMRDLIFRLSVMLSSFVDAIINEVELEHLTAHNCARLSIGSSDYFKNFTSNYGHLLRNPIPIPSIDDIGLEQKVVKQLFVKGDSGYAVKDTSLTTDELENMIREVIVEPEQQSKVLAVVSASRLDDSAAKQKLFEHMPILKSLEDKLKDTKFDNFYLTTTGMMLGLMLVEGATGTKLDHSIWIYDPV